jgi:hypothetical protein
MHSRSFTAFTLFLSIKRHLKKVSIRESIEDFFFLTADFYSFNIHSIEDIYAFCIKKIIERMSLLSKMLYVKEVPRAKMAK